MTHWPADYVKPVLLPKENIFRVLIIKPLSFTLPGSESTFRISFILGLYIILGNLKGDSRKGKCRNFELSIPHASYQDPY